MKLIVFTSPAITAQVNEWLSEHPDIEVIAMSQSEFESTIHLSLLYKEKRPVA